MKIIGITRRIGNSAQDNEARAALLLPEIHEAWRLQQSDFIREFYLAPQQQAVVVIIEAASEAEAAERLKVLPMVRDELLVFDLIGLAPYPSFAKLFRAEYINGPA